MVSDYNMDFSHILKQRKQQGTERFPSQDEKEPLNCNAQTQSDPLKNQDRQIKIK